MALTLPKATAAFILSEGEGSISRDTVTITNGQDLAAGTVLGKISKGAGTFAHVAGGTGNSTCGAITVGAGSKAGVYELVATAATKFTVEDPDGLVAGTLTLASAFTGGGLTFTMTAGGTAHVAGDRATITVAAGAGTYSAHDPGATTGIETAAAILYAAADASGGAVSAVAITRLAEVSTAELTWHTGITADEKTAAKAALATSHIIVR